MLRPSKWFGWSRSSSNESLNAHNKPHSLEHLKYLYNLLEKNQIVNDNNRTLLVETLRRIAEILIWGDQNDSTVFDFFLEKNMLYFFLRIMKQKCGGYVCTQLLQTLNILFENIKNETSLYYLLSNNHVNSIIVHKFDFDNEEVMAYYISFLKTLSLKLNNHTVHFFFNEHTADFPLYTEAIKFFNHSEKMVRIAVRTLTLNVFRVRERAMIKFIRDCTAAPYFSNLSWFIGNNVLDIGNAINSHIETIQSSSSLLKSNSNFINRLEDFVAEHLDHLHYLNDILRLEIGDLNSVLSDNLIYRLITPLYVHSFLSLLSNVDYSHKSKLFLVHEHSKTEHPGKCVSTDIHSVLTPSVALFLLTQAHIIFSYGPLLNTLVKFLLRSNENDFKNNAKNCEFTPPNKSLEAAIEQAISSSSNVASFQANSLLDRTSLKSVASDDNFLFKNSSEPSNDFHHLTNLPMADEEKGKLSRSLSCSSSISSWRTSAITNHVSQVENRECVESPVNNLLLMSDWLNRPFLVALLSALNSNICKKICLNESSLLNKTENDVSYEQTSFSSLFKSCHSSQVLSCIPELHTQDDRLILFALSLISSILCNNVIKSTSYQGIFTATVPAESQSDYESNDSFCTTLLNSLLFIMRQCCSYNPSIRLVTFELAVDLFKKIVLSNRYLQSSENNSNIFITDHQLALIEQANEDASHLLRQYFCMPDRSIFLELFENEAKIAAAAMMSDANECFDKSTHNHPTSAKIWSHNFQLNLEKLFMESTLLLPPKDIDQLYSNSNSNFYLRLPVHDYEKTRYAIQIFFVFKRLSFDIRSANVSESDNVDEKQFDFSTLLVNSTSSSSIMLDQFIDLENCDLNACSVKFYYPVNQSKSFGQSRVRKSTNLTSIPVNRSSSPSVSSNKKVARFMAIIGDLAILIEPDEKRYGWGVIRFIARLQDMELLSQPQAISQITTPPIPEKEKDDSRSIYVFFRRHLLSSSLTDMKYSPTISKTLSDSASIIARFSFHDTIRSFAAINNLKKAQKKEIYKKIAAIGQLIDLKPQDNPHLDKCVNEQTRTHLKSKDTADSSKKYHPILNRTYAVPGVAVQSKTSSEQATTSVMNQNVSEFLNKKRFAYPASQTKIKITNVRASMENERKRKKKPKLPTETVGDGIPLNDLSPKTIRKNILNSDQELKDVPMDETLVNKDNTDKAQMAFENEYESAHLETESKQSETIDI